MRTRLALGAGRALAATSRRLGIGAGSTVGGRLSLALDPSVLRRLGEGRCVMTVTGTNGKTTTTRLLAAALGHDGHPVASNDTGANLAAGLVATLGSSGAERVALEVDEGYLPGVLDQIEPRAALLLNLSRDQLDRIGEVRNHAKAWRLALERSRTTVAVANADDPLVVHAAGAASRVVWVGTGQRWRLDSATCGSCGHRVAWDARRSDRGGAHWTCSGCGLARPEPAVWLDGDDLVTPHGRHRLDLALPGWPNRANAAMAAAGAELAGVGYGQAVAAMASVTEVAGRYRELDLDGTRVRLLLAKNPAGWAETLDLLSTGVPVVIGINARVADGKDPSWLWDVDFERLEGRRLVATGERARDLSVRLAYAGLAHSTVTSSWADAIRAAAGPDHAVDVAANYTSFQAARRELTR